MNNLEDDKSNIFTTQKQVELPSFVGSSIADKPAYMKRNEKFHKENHTEFVPTIEELSRKNFTDKFDETISIVRNIAKWYQWFIKTN